MLPHSGVNARGHQVEARRWVRLDVPSAAHARKVAHVWLVREVGPSVVRVGLTAYFKINVILKLKCTKKGSTTAVQPVVCITGAQMLDPRTSMLTCVFGRF